MARAYAELESQGVIETVAGKGCFVRAASSPFRKAVRLELLTQEIDDAVTQAYLTRVLTLLLIAGFIAVLLRFALTNHRSAEPAAGRVWRQAILMAAFVAAEVMILAGLEAFEQ